MTDRIVSDPTGQTAGRAEEQKAKKSRIPDKSVGDKRPPGNGKKGSLNIDDPDRPRWNADTTEEARYPYHRSDGTEAYFILRGRNPDGGRPTTTRRPNGIPFSDRLEPEDKHDYFSGQGDEPLIPYRLPDLIEATREPGTVVLVVEGEKDADTARRLGYTATTNPHGAMKWRDEFSLYLRGCQVVVVPDNDEVGREHAEKVVRSVMSHAQSVQIVHLPGLAEKGDLTDWAEGMSVDEATKALGALIKHAPPAEVRKRKNAPAPNVDNIACVIENHPAWKGIIAYDEFADEMMLLQPVPGTTVPKTTFRPRQWRDSDDVSALRWFNRNGFPRVAKSTVADAVVDVAQRTLISPVRDYLENLTWDGEERLSRFLIDDCSADIEDDEGDVPGAKAEFVAEVGRRWMISAVARAIEPGCKADACLVLEGRQGIGKSTLLRILADGYGQPKGRRSWFSDSLQQFIGKDTQSALRGCWIFELPEMAAMRRAEVEHVKAFLSRQEDRYRPAYGRREVEMPRRCLFAGTTNRADYLKDETGNRRFWPVRVTNVDMEKLKDDRDQLWAEAMQAYRSGEAWHLTGNAAVYQVKAAEERSEEDPWSKALEYVSDIAEVTTREVLEFLGMGVSSQSKADARRGTCQRL